ncbi:YceK/YidQ family lipoprotein [Arsenophonus apicola]|uniref:YceK/YidQ family lipoprotein n=1 Tax=Arsenophonus apicola TaxID=2879119 RepID=A0ABY8P1U8_9GAMM|nr:YceK/YidQ family lipoprotein [Arsenophonus apicola]WGO83483.1 YceK/YidQ family lipoprotein [Arsenophonus apicola]
MTRLILVIYTICLNIFSCLILLSGCSSIMTHVGPHQGYYSGTKADSRILKDSDTGWVIKPLAMIDLPFSALLDTVLLPYDYFQVEKVVSLPSPKERVQNWENDQVANTPQQISAKN